MVIAILEFALKSSKNIINSCYDKSLFFFILRKNNASFTRGIFYLSSKILRNHLSRKSRNWQLLSKRRIRIETATNFNDWRKRTNTKQSNEGEPTHIIRGSEQARTVGEKRQARITRGTERAQITIWYFSIYISL